MAARVWAIAALAFLAFGCTAQQQTKDTHYWDGQAQSEHDYRLDNAACATQNDTDADAPMATDSLSFQAYRDCMIGKGYVLRTY